MEGSRHWFRCHSMNSSATLATTGLALLLRPRDDHGGSDGRKRALRKKPRFQDRATACATRPGRRASASKWAQVFRHFDAVLRATDLDPRKVKNDSSARSGAVASAATTWQRHGGRMRRKMSPYCARALQMETRAPAFPSDFGNSRKPLQQGRHVTSLAVCAARLTHRRLCKLSTTVPVTANFDLSQVTG